MNELQTLDSIDGMLANLTDKETVSTFITDLNSLEALLKAAKKFNEYARKFARLEAEMYVKIVDAGWAEEIPAKNYQRRTALWLARLSQDERDKVIEHCGSEGVTISYYWKNVVHAKAQVDRAIKAYKEMGEYAIETFKEHGEVCLDKVMTFHSNADNCRLPYDFAKGYKDQVRDKIRQLGGHGLGDGQGTYVSVKQAYSRLYEVCENKVRSIAKDIARLRQVVHEAEKDGEDLSFMKEYCGIKRAHNHTCDLSIESTVSVLFCLNDLARPYWQTEHQSDLVLNLLAKLGIKASDVKKWLDAEGDLSYWDNLADQPYAKWGDCNDTLGHENDIKE